MAFPKTYKELTYTVLAIRPSVARATIVTKDRSLFDTIEVDTNNVLLQEVVAYSN